MATTVKKIINKAFQKSGIMVGTQQPTSDEANDALDALNAMLSSWSNDSMLIYARTWETFNLVGGQSKYQIGPGAPDFNTVRPIDILSSHIIITGQSNYNVAVLNDEAFNEAIRLPSAPGLPKWINYDNAYPVANIRLWPVPTTAWQIFILTEKILSQFLLNDAFDLPPGWERALIFNLAIEIASDYEQTPPAATVKIAGESLALIKKAIAKNHNFDAFPQQPAPNNIFTGWNR